MLSKSQSCGKCINKIVKPEGQSQNYKKIVKKPESYLTKKFQQLYQQDKKLRNKKLNKIEQHAKQKLQKQVQGCTFKPQINNNPEYHIANQSFLKRQENWKKNIQKKISQKRQQMSKKQVDGFTFQPKITQSPLNSSQIKKKNMTSRTSGYSSKNSLVEKKSYKVIHSERKKLMQTTKIKIIQPFKHRHQASSLDSNPSSPQLNGNDKNHNEIMDNTTADRKQINAQCHNHQSDKQQTIVQQANVQEEHHQLQNQHLEQSKQQSADLTDKEHAEQAQPVYEIHNLKANTEQSQNEVQRYDNQNNFINEKVFQSQIGLIDKLNEREEAQQRQSDVQIPINE